MITNLFWKPAGFVPSLASLEPGQGVAAKWDVTMAVRGSNEGSPLTVVELAGGKIIGNLRMVATADDVLIGGLQSLPPGMDPQNHYLARRRRFRLPKYRRGTALLLGAANSDNYFHWMLESVPRWRMLQAANQFDYDFVLLHSEPLKFQDEVLDRMAIPAEKRLRCSKNFVHQFERLVVPSMPFLPDRIAAWACSYVRSLFPEKASGPENIYLRRGPGRRRLVNEIELEAALAKIGFVSIDPGRSTAAEQAGFLSSARCIVAPHGAALTNIIFAPAGALIVELIHLQYRWGCYPDLAETCGHRCVGIEGTTINRPNDAKLEYFVDVSAVLQVIAGNQSAAKSLSGSDPKAREMPGTGN